MMLRENRNETTTALVSSRVCASMTTNEKRENVLEKRIYSSTNQREEQNKENRKKREKKRKKETGRIWYGDAC